MLLVTGATGFIGRHFVEILRERNIAFRATGRSGAYWLTDIGSINADTDWAEALKGVDTVIHLAAINENVIEDLNSGASQFTSVNVDGTAQLAREAVRSGVRKFILLSTVKVNGEATCDGKPFTSHDHPAPQTPYAQSKYEAEEILKRISLQSQMQAWILRSPLVYGSGSKGSFNALAWLVEQGWPLPFGLIRNRRSMVHVENLCDLILATHYYEKAPLKIQTLMVSEGFAVSTPQLCEMIACAKGRRAVMLPIAPWLLKIAGKLVGRSALVSRLTQNLEVDDSEVQRLGWTPKLSPQEALRRSV